MLEKDKYKSDTFRIFGLALMSPLGKDVLQFNKLFVDGISNLENKMFFLDILLFVIGFMLILEGYIIIRSGNGIHK